MVMAGVCGAVLTAWKAIKSFAYDNVKEYVGYVGSCEDNLAALRKSLSDVCDKKDDIDTKVKDGNGRLEDITREAKSWLKEVRILTGDEELKGLMYKDIETAKFVVKMMGNKYLKRHISEKSEMQELVIKVMSKLKEEMDISEEEMRKTAEEDYKQVAEVVVEVMKDTIDKFKKLLKEDKNMAVIATRMLKDSELDKLTKDDEEMMEIVREAENTIDEELWPNQVDDESNVQPLLVKIPEMGVSENIVKEAAKKLFTPLAYLVTPLGKLMDDADFKKAVPHAVNVKLGLEVIDGLLIRGRGSKKEMDDPTKQDNMGCCCCCSPCSLCSYYHGRYLVSKAAKSMVKYIQDELIGKCPRDPFTLRKNPQDLKPIPSQFLVGLDSRTQLLHQILEKLIDGQVDSIGLFGMGGIGKTTLAKEVINSVKDAFAIKVMVEVSQAPDIVRIQAAIAESVDLPLHDVSNVGQRAIRLYNRLISEKKKILIILDNVWEKLNLDEIGIPETCKLLFTTRDRDVCRVMDVRDVNILEVGVMNTNEARELFKSQARNQADVREYKNLIERLLSKCGGLPLAIVAIANLLKDKDLSSWEKVADDLEKPASNQMSGYYRHTFMILNTSYKFIQLYEKRIFFLLVCLFPLGSSVSIESLMRYGMGLNLFEHVNNLSEAMEQAATWANELKLGSMLLEGDVKGDVKIHDIVRDYAISHAAGEEKHKFMVEAIPRLLRDETLKKYTAMSLTSKNDYSRLSGVKACKLQILILKGDLSPNFDDNFFNGMLNLEVLVVSNMNFRPSLPKSMRKLKKLGTLCMEGCKLGNFELVGELVNLLVLSLRGSSMENIPNEVGNLRELRLLDLGGCTSSKSPLISTSVLNKLSTLEGLYMYNTRQSVLEKKTEYEEANAIVNIRLPCLNALEMIERDIELPFDGQSIENLDKFRISIGKFDVIPEEDFQNSCRTLYLSSIEDMSGFVKISCHKLLLKKAEYLKIYESRNFEGVVPQLDQDGFKCLTSLHLRWCHDIKYIVDGRTMSNMIVFPCLQSLTLDWLESLEKVCNGDVSPASFSNLQTIQLSHLDELRYGLPLVPRNVKEIDVFYCHKLEFIFVGDEEVLATDLPFLKTLKLRFLDSLLSLVGPKEFSKSYDALREPRLFFGGKIGLPSLEEFKLDRCHNVGKLWGKEIDTPAFQNLKNIQIDDCHKLSNVGSSSVFSNLVQLENLSISCDEMHEVISHEEIEESEIGEHSIVFPQLKYLELNFLSNLESFYGGRSKLVFPKLKTLILKSLKSMKMFAKLENSSALFNEKIDFQCLEELEVMNVNYEVMGLWDKQSLTTKLNPAPMLRQLELGSLAGLRQIPSIVLENLSSLTLTDFHFKDGDAVFSSSNLGEKGGFVLKYSQLPNLKGLNVGISMSLKELFEKEEYNAVDDALTSFCGQVKTLGLGQLPELNLIPLHLFKSIASLTFCDLMWNYLISADNLNSLHQLQFLKISGCDKMEALVINVGSQINLPSLKQLHLSFLNSFIGISSPPENKAALLVPSLESLEVSSCHKLEHFWSSSISAPRLQDVSIKNCNKVQHLLVGNLEDTIELPSLRKVSSSGCVSIKSISTSSITAPKLREVTLRSCDNMQYFIPGNQNQDGDLQLPSLEVVDIYDCRSLHAFSLRRVVAPKLTQITYYYQEYSMLPYDDLNDFLKEMLVVFAVADAIIVAVKEEEEEEKKKKEEEEEEEEEEEDDDDINED